MPNSGHRWNDQEDTACQTMDWPEFSARFNDGEGAPLITWDAYRQRRGMLSKGGPPRFSPFSVPALPVGGSPDDYVGLEIGFFDIETTFSSQPRVLYAAVSDAWGRVTEFALDDPAYIGNGWLDDSRLVSAYARHLEQYDVLCGWNHKLFDTPVINGRLNWHRVHWEREPDFYPWVLDRRDLMPLEPRMQYDLMYLASGAFNRIGRRSLKSVSEYFESPHAKTPLSPHLWDLADHGDTDAYRLIKEHGAADVLVTRDVFGYLKPHIRNLHR